jgi:translation initiation factor 4E
MWEDPANEKGGKWVLQVPRGGPDRTRIDQFWLATVLAVIGEQLASSHEVTGAVVSLRKGQDKIALWTRSANKGNHDVKQLGKQWKEVIEHLLPPGTLLEFSDHKARRGTPPMFTA